MGNPSKGLGLAILVAVALTIFLTTAFDSGKSQHEAATSRSAAATLADGGSSEATAATTRTPAPRKAGHHVILVVGDSVVDQAQARLRDASDSAVTVDVASEPGSAPCDWTTGMFDAQLAADHPDIVVLAFVGNAGLTAGCVSTKEAFPLTQLLSNYRVNLTALANRATAAGATVIIANPPARNPGVPAPPVTPTIGELAAPDQFYGYQGVPEIRALYAQIVASNRLWHLSSAAALAVSPGFVYKQILSCGPLDGSCPDGFVAVRKGRTDAIHLDTTGNGAKRYAKAMVDDALAIVGHSAGA